MQQTLSVLVAVLALSLLVIAQQEVWAGDQAPSPSAETEATGARLAHERLAHVLSHRFDEAAGPETRAAARDRSPSLGPDAGEALERDFDDVDDFHGRPARTVGGPGRVTFTDSVSVRYLTPGPDGALRESPVPTLVKEVTVTVRVRPGGSAGVPPVVATLRRTVTPAP